MKQIISVETVAKQILLIRRLKVMLDSDLADYMESDERTEQGCSAE